MHAQNRLIKSAILVIAVTPLFLGEVVRTYSWIVVLGNNGFINSVLLKLGLIDRPLQIMFTTFGVVIALVHVTLPVMVIMLAAALAHIDPDYEKAAAEPRRRPDPRVPYRDIAALHARHHRRRHHGVCLDVQRLCNPAADRRRPGQHGLEPRLPARPRELQLPLRGQPLGGWPRAHLRDPRPAAASRRARSRDSGRIDMAAVHFPAHVADWPARSPCCAILGFVLLPAAVVTLAAFNDKAILVVSARDLVVALVCQGARL